MLGHTLTANLADVDPADPADDRVARRLRLLEELAEIGMDLARALRRQVLAQAEAVEPVAGDVGLSFSRIARAVRLTLALEARLADETSARRAAAAAERAEVAEQERRRALFALPPVDPRRMTIERIVEQVVEAEAAGAYEADTLMGRAAERLDEHEDYDDLDDRPIGEIVARICRDLGLTPDWSLWADEDWAVEEARTGAEGSPYAAAGRADAGFAASPVIPQVAASP